MPQLDLSPIRGVAFDLDGTTLNSEDLYLIVCQELMRRRGHEYDPVTRAAMMGLPAPQAYEVLIQSKRLQDTPQQLQDECDELFSDLLPRRLAAMPDVTDLLDALDVLRLPRCIATSSRLSFANRALEIVGLANRFDFVITAEHVSRGKPSPDIYLAAAERMSLPLNRLLVLEDSAIGVSAGVAAGAVVVAVPNEHTRGSNYAGAVAVCDSLQPLIEGFRALRVAAI